MDPNNYQYYFAGLLIIMIIEDNGPQNAVLILIIEAPVLHAPSCRSSELACEDGG